MTKMNSLEIDELINSELANGGGDDGHQADQSEAEEEAKIWTENDDDDETLNMDELIESMITEYQSNEHGQENQHNIQQIFDRAQPLCKNLMIDGE